MEHTISISQIIGVSAILIPTLIAILSVWIGTRIKIQKIETTMNLKLIEIENKMNERDKAHDKWVSEIKLMVATFLSDNKEEHRELSHDTKNIRQSLGLVNERLALLTGRTNES